MRIAENVYILRHMEDIISNFADVHKVMSRGCEMARRDRDDVTLVAVSKRQDMDKIRSAVVDVGQRVFGENRVQEAQEHWADLKREFSDIQLHLIGPLQSNKVADAVALFDVIEVVDRPKIAMALSDEMAKQGRDLPCFIQVNTGAEPQKAGVLPDEIGDFLDMAHGECGLDIRGLMCIPPVDEPAGFHFAFLKTLADRHGLKELSMGMSADYEAAIWSGATYVRVGSGLFGLRS